MIPNNPEVQRRLEDAVIDVAKVTGIDHLLDKMVPLSHCQLSRRLFTPVLLFGVDQLHNFLQGLLHTLAVGHLPVVVSDNLVDLFLLVVPHVVGLLSFLLQLFKPVDSGLGLCDFSIKILGLPASVSEVLV